MRRISMVTWSPRIGAQTLAVRVTSIATRRLLSITILVIGDPTHRKPLLQQMHQRRCRLCLPFLRNLLKDGLDRALDQRSQDCIGVHADHARHGDRLGEYAYRVGPAGSDALGTSGEVIDGGEMTVWHDGASMTGSGCARQGLPRNSVAMRNVVRRPNCEPAMRQWTHHAGSSHFSSDLRLDDLREPDRPKIPNIDTDIKLTRQAASICRGCGRAG